MTEAGIHLFIGFRGVSLEEELRYLIREYRPGGIILFKRNIEGRDQLKALVSNAQALAIEEIKRPLLFAIDQEGGAVQRLSPYFNTIPSAKDLAGQGREAVRRWAAISSADLLEVGIQINLAPVLDIVAEDRAHFMGSRSFGSTPATVSDLGNAWIQTLQANRISATAKHFPGLGLADLDPHYFTPVIRDEKMGSFMEHMAPFQSAIKAGVNCVMTSHAVYRAVDNAHPATLSPEICRRWLRERFGFRGVLFADDLDMAAISENYSPEDVVCLGLSCSTDFFLLCQKSESIEPMHRALVDQLDKKPALRALHFDSIRRIRMLTRFHFPDLE